MRIQFLKTESHYEIFFSGSMTVKDLMQHQKKLSLFLEAGLPVQLDLSKVKKFDTAALQFLLFWQRRWQALGLSWKLVSCSRLVLNYLSLTGAKSYLLEEGDGS